MKRVLLLVILAILATSMTPAMAQGGPGTRDFYVRDFEMCINLPDFTVVSNPDVFNTEYDVPGLFTIHFAEYLMPLASLPSNGDEIYGAMVTLLDTVNASNYSRIGFDHYQYVSAAVEFSLDGRRQFGMIYRNQSDKIFFLFADKVDGFDMLAIGRAIFAARRNCRPVAIPVRDDYSNYPATCNQACSQLTCAQARQCAGHPDRDADRDGMACENDCW